MLRKLLAGLRSLLGFVENIFLMPFRMLLGGGGMPGMAEPEFTELPPEKTAPAPVPDPTTAKLIDLDLAMSHKRACLEVIRFASVGLRTGDTSEISNRIPKAVKAWLPGLTRRELQLLVAADYCGISDHISGKKLVFGVPKVSPLPKRTPSRRR